jgi:transcriptional regulator with XRE-family HTH domain
VLIVTTASSKLIERAIESLACEISQSEIARKAGFKRPNMLSMIKTGKARLPLDRVPALAASLRVDPTLLFRTAMADYWPEHERTIRLIFRDVLTENEWALVDVVRSVTHDEVPRMTPAVRLELERLFKVAS